MSRRRGSAMALKESEVVAARGMVPIYSHISICQALFLLGSFSFQAVKDRYTEDDFMPSITFSHVLNALLFWLCLPVVSCAANAWAGTVYDASGKAVTGAVVRLHSPSGAHNYEATTAKSGEFHFDAIEMDSYAVSVTAAGKTW